MGKWTGDTGSQWRPLSTRLRDAETLSGSWSAWLQPAGAMCLQQPRPFTAHSVSRSAH